MSRTPIWECKVGSRSAIPVPDGADLPMRSAVQQTFFLLTGKHPEFIFSGWSAELTPIEEAVLDNVTPKVKVGLSAEVGACSHCKRSEMTLYLRDGTAVGCAGCFGEFFQTLDPVQRPWRMSFWDDVKFLFRGPR